MQPAAAKETWWKGEPLSKEDLEKLVKERVRAYRVDPRTIVVVVSTESSKTQDAYNVITCTRPPCWPPFS